MENAIEYNPFTAEALEDPTKVLLTFFSDLPAPDLIEKFESTDYDTDKIKFEKKYAYLYCANGYGKAKINNNYLESKLKIKATTRNWKTILKLFEILTVS